MDWLSVELIHYHTLPYKETFLPPEVVEQSTLLPMSFREVLEYFNAPITHEPCRRKTKAEN